MKQDTKRFFRSINLKLDIDKPEHFSHFWPTSKSANVVKAIVEGNPDPASIVVASFGSGKSLAAGTAAMIVNNDPKSRKQLRIIADLIKKVDIKLGRLALARANSRVRGLSIVLVGYQNSLPNALISDAKTRLKYLRKSPGAIEALDAISKQAEKQNIDRIAIVWDEFGQHLETLASTGKTESLLEVQQVAEWAARQNNPHVSLTLLMHHNLAQYASGLSQMAKSSWRKIEGRFGSIQYVEDSDEMYRLVASIASRFRPANIKLPSMTYFKSAVANALKSGFYKSYSQRSNLHKVLREAYPLLPATLHELPKMASRLAQNERTIFTFLRKADFSSPISLLDLYRFFSYSMRVDVGAGGSYRKWLETESALSKVAKDAEKEMLAAATILGFGVSGERKRVSKNALAFASATPEGVSTSSSNKTIDELIERKLLLYRKNSDDVSVWHGTDIDIRSRLREIRDSLLGEIDNVDFLQKENAAPNYKPIRHNIDNSIRRYFQGRFALAHELVKSGHKHKALRLAPQEDGAVIFCIAENKREVTLVSALADQFRSEDSNRLIFVIPSSPLPISGLVSEIVALRRLQHDNELLAEDPFLLPEIQDMIDAAQEHLSIVLRRLVTPDTNNNIWVTKGIRLKMANEYDLHQNLSAIADDAYHHTPFINNELIVRRHVSRQMINARKKLILGILERSQSEHLGFVENATTPDATLYRTVLKHTKLINKFEKGVVWATPAQLKNYNKGISEVWKEIQNFYTKPAKEKSFEEIINKLVSPPYGTRTGTIPILLAAGMKAFGKTIAIKHKGIYLPDILASQIEKICTSPEEYSIDVLPNDEKLRNYLAGLSELFSKEKETGEDLIRHLFDTIVKWKSRLPPSALTTSRVNKETKLVQRALKGDFDPVELSLEQLPDIVQLEWEDPNVLPRLKNLFDEIDCIIDGYLANAIKIIREQLAISPNSPGSTLRRVQEWAVCFTKDSKLMSKIGTKAKAILLRSIEAPNGRFTEASFARAISAILIEKNFEQWDDASVQLFGDSLRDIVSTLEHTALTSTNPSPALIPLLRSRLQYYENKLEQLEKGPVSEKTPERRSLAKKL